MAARTNPANPRVRSESAALKNWNGEPIRARAWLESGRIEERYQYSQEISLNADVNVKGEPSGLIKLVLPYDGDKYFTQQAYKDLVGARHGGASPADEAIIGFLALAGHEKTGLEGPLGLDANYGSVPIRCGCRSRPTRARLTGSSQMAAPAWFRRSTSLSFPRSFRYTSTSNLMILTQPSPAPWPGVGVLQQTAFRM